MEITEKEDPDCGHATLVRIQNSWIIAFDFRYNKGLARKHVDTAKQFYDSAEFAFNRKNWSSCLDNLFSAAELAAKAVLLLIADPIFAKKVKHGGIQHRYNKFADLGNVQQKYRDALNKLFGLRASARYLKGDIQLSEEEIKGLLESVKKMIDDATERIQFE